MTESLVVSRLNSDEAGVSHFVDESLPWGEMTTESGTFAVTDLFPANSLGYLRLPIGSQSSWHPAPRKQYVMVLTGAMEVVAGDGERRTFEPGRILLVTDVAGQGHCTNVVSDEEVLLVWVPVP